MTHSHPTDWKKSVTVHQSGLQKGQFINPVWQKASKQKCCQNGPCIRNTFLNAKVQCLLGSTLNPCKWHRSLSIQTTLDSVSGLDAADSHSFRTVDLNAWEAFSLEPNKMFWFLNRCSSWQPRVKADDRQTEQGQSVPLASVGRNANPGLGYSPTHNIVWTVIYQLCFYFKCNTSSMFSSRDLCRKSLSDLYFPRVHF